MAIQSLACFTINFFCLCCVFCRRSARAFAFYLLLPRVSLHFQPSLFSYGGQVTRGYHLSSSARIFFTDLGLRTTDYDNCWFCSCSIVIPVAFDMVSRGTFSLSSFFAIFRLFSAMMFFVSSLADDTFYLYYFIWRVQIESIFRDCKKIT